MIPESLQPLLQWVALHPTWAGLVVFLIAAAESLAIVGLFVPGVLMMFSIGALVGTGSLALWPTLAWAVAGAIAGDGVSFWLGRHFHQRLRVMWPFRSYPTLMARGVDFFHRHGGKSVVLGRFMGPVRPIIPAVAGMLDMPPSRFFVINVISATLWAPAYILPGMAFGASLQLAAAVAGRLVVLLLVLAAALWLSAWLVQRALRLLQPRANPFVARALDWSRNHPHIRPLAGALLDPGHPEARGLAVLAGILFTAFLLFAAILVQVVHGRPLTSIDLYVYQSLQSLRTPWGDHLMVAVTEFGDAAVLGALVGAVALWLAWTRRTKALGHWLAVAACAWISTRLLKLVTHVARPVHLYDGVAAFSFPSGHAVQSAAIYGFLAVLVARELRPQRRWLPYTAAALLVAPIALSRLYLGAHWLTDVGGGLTLGLGWVALLGIGYGRHPGPRVAPGGLLAVALAALAGGAAWHMERRFDGDLQRYAQRPPVETITTAAWRTAGWRELPAYRRDLEGSRDHPLDLQWAGTLATVQRDLAARGWHPPPPRDLGNLLRWQVPATPMAELPVLPQVHGGRHEALLLVHPTADPGVVQVLRLWRADLRLTDPVTPLWIGNVSLLRRRELFHLLVLPRTERDFDTPLRQLTDDLARLAVTVRPLRRDVRPAAGDPRAPLWDGTVLLVEGGHQGDVPRKDVRARR